MSKIIKFIAMIVTIVLFINVTISYAKSSNSSDKFFSINKTQIAPKETLEMTFDISKINYDEFTITLNSNINVKDISVKDNVENSVDNVNNISIEIDKTKINLNKITLYYDIPENMKSGEKITLNAQVLANNSKTNTSTKNENNNTASNPKNESNKEKNNTKNETSDNKETKNTTSSSDKKKVVLEKKIEVTISKQSNNENKDNEEDPKEDSNDNTDKKEMNNDKNQNSDKNSNEKVSQKGSNNSEKSKSSSNQKVTSSTKTSTTQVSESESAVYNGSSNNYLSNIEIEGASLKTIFNKEKQTYFAEGEGLTSVNVTATNEDTNAKVYITGNESIKTGTNKILISVTAQNGEVRYYRIFLENK